MPCCNTFYLVYSALHSGVCSLPSWWSYLQAHSMKFTLPYTGHGWKFWIEPDWASEPSVKLCWKHACSLTVVVIYYLQFFLVCFVLAQKLCHLHLAFLPYTDNTVWPDDRVVAAIKNVFPLSTECIMWSVGKTVALTLFLRSWCCLSFITIYLKHVLK